jgi:hypothetical protein
MNDVKLICELALDVAAPSLPDAAETVAVARRSKTRRIRLMVGGYGVGAMATVTVAALATVTLTPSAQSRPLAAPPIPVAASSSAAPPVPVLAPKALSQAAGDVHGHAILDLLSAVVPAGYGAAPDYVGTDVYTSWAVGAADHYVSGATLLVSAGSGQGDLEVFIRSDGTPAPNSDLCSAEVNAQFAHDIYDPPGSPCEVVTVDGVAIRVTTAQLPELGEVKVATRFLQGGILQVIAQQGTPDYGHDGPLPPDASKQQGQATAHKPPLSAQPFTSTQLARLAANPAMLP